MSQNKRKNKTKQLSHPQPKKKKGKEKKKKKATCPPTAQGQKKKNWTWAFLSIKQSHFFPSIFSSFWKENVLIDSERKHSNPIIYFPYSLQNQTHSKSTYKSVNNLIAVNNSAQQIYHLYAHKRKSFHTLNLYIL